MDDRARAAHYREQQVLTASPIERVIIVYDAVLTACAAQDVERCLRGLSLLRSALDWEAAPEIAPRLQALYEFCEECVRQQDFATPQGVLRELRGTWAEARKSASKAADAEPARPFVHAGSAFSVAG